MFVTMKYDYDIFCYLIHISFWTSCHANPFSILIFLSRLSVSVMFTNHMDHILFIFYFWQWNNFFFCWFVVFLLYIISCSWVTKKNLECESLCSSCTRTEIIVMIIKKNMTKLFKRHFRGGPVYCCIVNCNWTKLQLKKYTAKRLNSILVFLCPCVP